MILSRAAFQFGGEHLSTITFQCQVFEVESFECVYGTTQSMFLGVVHGRFFGFAAKAAPREVEAAARGGAFRKTSHVL